MAKIDDARKEFYAILHRMPCLVCGTLENIEADHIKAFSLKTRSFSHRSHKGANAFFAVPLCREHHRQKTASNEEEWYEKNVHGGLKTAYGVALAITIEAWNNVC